MLLPVKSTCHIFEISGAKFLLLQMSIAEMQALNYDWKQSDGKI